VATVVLPVIALVPAVLVATFLTLVAPLISHRCREPLADLTSSQCLVARTTTPRCAAKVVCLVWVVAKVRIGAICDNALSALVCEVFQVLNAVVRAVASLIIRWLECCQENPADVAAEGAEWFPAATATAPIAPPPTSTAAAMPSRAFMLAWRLPRLLRPIFDLPPSVNPRPHRASTNVVASPPSEGPFVYDSETAAPCGRRPSILGPRKHHVREMTEQERTRVRYGRVEPGLDDEGVTDPRQP
jgi:hypothetical protein